MPNNPVGSLWHKWDLHFHTPSSYDYENKSVSNVEIIEELMKKNIEVVAITDHHYIDVNRITELRKISDNKLTILPGIELRSELGGKPIHFTGIFSEVIDLNYLWDTLRGSLKLTKEGIQGIGGDEKVYKHIDKTHKVFIELGGLLAIHAGAKSNSIEGIKNKEQFQQRIKFDITNNYVDIFEIGQIKDITRYMNKVFPATGLQRPLVIGSDNHNINKYSFPTPCWLKSDLTFIGLRQVINEPIDRVYIGERPESIDYVDNNKTRYIETLSYSKRSASTLKQNWFSDVSLKFNPGLIAIIGNKGNGKSALADSLGLLGNCPHEESYSFLHEDQFRQPRENKAICFDATLTWRSGSYCRKNLNDSFNPTEIESIRYVPQFHLEAICDELKGGKEGRFNEELKNVIFSRIPIENRLGKTTLDHLVEFRTSEFQEKTDQIIQELKNISEEVVKLERESTESYEKSIQSELKAIEKEIESHRGNKPEEIKKPGADPKKQKEIETITEKIEELSKKVKTFNKQIEKNEEELQSVVLKLEQISKLRKKLNNFKDRYETLKNEISPFCKTLGIQTNEILSLTIGFSKLNELEQPIKDTKENLEKSIDENDARSIVNHKNKTIKEIEKSQDKLDRPNKEYQNYLEAKSEWEKKEKKLIGNDKIPGTLKYYTAFLKELKKVPLKLSSARKKQIEYSKKIYQEKVKQLRIYEELYTPVQDFIDTHPIAKEHFGLEFRVSLSTRDFPTRFLEFINQSRKGSFH